LIHLLPREKQEDKLIHLLPREKLEVVKYVPSVRRTTRSPDEAGGRPQVRSGYQTRPVVYGLRGLALLVPLAVTPQPEGKKGHVTSIVGNSDYLFTSYVQ